MKIDPMDRPIIVLCIDRDNDLFEKAKISGPLIGREKNLAGAMALALADPEDPDSNAIYCAVKTYDQLRKDGQNAEVVTLTGDKGLGYRADKSISSQLENVVAQLQPVSCILISDGASDEEIVPIIKSRIRIDSTKVVFIKQAKELEKTYFVILEKLRDPIFARTFVGIPAVLILLFSLSTYFGFGWEPIGVIVGIYPLLWIFGVDRLIMDFIRDFRFSFERTSWVGYVGALAIFGIAFFVGYQTLQDALRMGIAGEKVVALVLSSTIWIVFIGMLMILTGKAIDAVIERRRYNITRYMYYATATGLSSLVILVGSLWIANVYEPYVDFGMFLITILLSMFLGYVANSLINWYRKEILLGMKLEGKEAISEHGTYLGRIVGVDAKRSSVIIQTPFDRKYAIPMTEISRIKDNIIFKSD